jgi:hypothetical protein
MMVEHYYFGWLVATLDAIFGSFSGVWFAAGLLPPVTLWAAWARRPLDCTSKEFVCDLETWNFGLPWTQAGLISTFVTGSVLAATWQVPSESPALILIEGKAFDIQVRADPAFFKLLFVTVVLLIMIAMVTLQIRSLHRLRQSRVQWKSARLAWENARKANLILTWPEWLAPGAIGRIRIRRIGWVAASSMTGATAVVGAYMLNGI